MGDTFHNDFWAADFWPPEFWGEDGVTPNVDYGFWPPAFWIDTHWALNFWQNVPGSVADGGLAATLAGLTPELVGDHNAPGSSLRQGAIAATLDGVTGSLGGVLAYITAFDLDLNVSVNWALADLPVFDGTIDVTLDDVGLSASGLAYDGSYTGGFIGTTETLWPPTFFDGRLFAIGYWPQAGSELEGVTAALTGSTVAPGSFTGLLVTTLDPLTGTLVGRFTAPAQFNGHLAAVLAGITSNVDGASVRPLFSGQVAGALDGLTFAAVGLFAPSGTFIGSLRANLAGVSAELSGTYDVPVRTGVLEPTLAGVTLLAEGLYVVEGGRVGQVRSVLDGVSALLSGAFTTPRTRSRTEVPQVSRIDWKTLCDQHNAGLEPVADYEFSNGRRFYQG